METAFLSVTELADGFRKGSFTPLDVAENALARLERLEPLLNAFASVSADLIRAQAVQATQELASGRDRGPLHGVPVAIKDLIEVEGMPTGYGSKVLPPRIATQDATLVARLRAAGAVLFGKTNLLEYAYGIAHPAIGQTNNPHDPGRTAGGSSGGSAAAVAAGIVPLAVGTDTGGSIRIPAAYCGIVGLKPTFGLVDLDGVFPLSQSLDHAGPLARNVEDAAVLLACMAGQAMPLLAQKPPRIGVIAGHFSTSAIGEAVSARCTDVLSQLRSGGVELLEITIPDIAHANVNLITILHPEASMIHGELMTINPSGYAPGTLAQIKEGFATTATDYLTARSFQKSLRQQIEAVFDQVDILAAPSVPFVAPIKDPVIVDGEDSEMLASGFANLTGHPSLSVPCGLINGLPFGLQLTAALGADAQLLAIARDIVACVNRG